MKFTHEINLCLFVGCGNKPLTLGHIRSSGRLVTICLFVVTEILSVTSLREVDSLFVEVITSSVASFELVSVLEVATLLVFADVRLVAEVSSSKMVFDSVSLLSTVVRYSVMCTSGSSVKLSSPKQSRGARITQMYMILLFLMVSVVKASGECPFPSGQFLKMGTNCRRYYQCKEGTAEEKVCPSGEMFSQDLGQCDWEEIVTCPDKDNLCVQQDGYFPKPGSKCKSYYACANGIPMEHLCPDERLFNQNNGICDWPELVNCRDGFPCPQPEGNFPKQDTKCKSYYQCRTGIPAEIVCPDDMLYSEDNAACDWPELVHCKDGDVALTSIKTTTSTRIPTESSPVPLTTKTSKLPTSSSISTPLLTTPTLKSTTTTPNSTPIRSTVSIGPSKPTTTAKFTQNPTVISTKATANTQEPNIVTNTASKSSMITSKFTQIPATKPTEVSTNTTPNLTTISSSTTKEISSPSRTATITKGTRSPTTIKRTTQKITTAFTSTTPRGCDLEDLDCEPNSLLCPEEF